MQINSAKIPIKYRRNRILNLFNLTRPFISLLKKISVSNLATMYTVDIIEPLFSVIDQLKLAVDNTEVNLTRTGFYLINPPLILCVKI